jgi:NADH dehydrogenase FAD-containing subunit
MLSILATQPLPSVHVTLVTPYPRQFYFGMLAGFVAGHYTLDDCVVPLEPFLNNSHVTWHQGSAIGLDAATRSLTLDDGSVLPYDVLSINSGAVQDRHRIEQRLPGAREHALFLRPIESFAALWPQVVQLGQKKPLRLAVIGGGAAGFELACAVAHQLTQSSVTLLSGESLLGPRYSEVVKTMALQELKQRGITVIQERAVGIATGEVMLASGARLACDVPLLATGTDAPTWLQGSQLALDANGYIAVDTYQRSTSHPQVFATGDVSTRTDVKLPRNGQCAVDAGPQLAKNLRAVLAGIEPSPQIPQVKTLQMLSCGGQSAIVSWGTWSAQGRLGWWLKDWLDRKFIRQSRKIRQT